MGFPVVLLWAVVHAEADVMDSALMAQGVVNATPAPRAAPSNRFLAKSARNQSVPEENDMSQPTTTNTSVACKDEGEPCVPSDHDCCGPYLACDTYTGKCIVET